MPTAAITTLRSTIATALTNNGVWSVFAYPPATILANSCVVIPADPYLVPSNNSQITVSPMANFRILLTCPMLDNQGNLQGIEEFIVAAVNKLAASTIVFNITSVSAPGVLNADSGDLLTAEFNITVLTSWS
jgi:hypothetical protein